jgi:hypothetical protein
MIEVHNRNSYSPICLSIYLTFPAKRMDSRRGLDLPLASTLTLRDSGMLYRDQRIAKAVMQQNLPSGEH